jgi:hypothetical protein
LPPRVSRLAKRKSGNRGILADENLDLLAHLLDDWFRIPGTKIRFGLDGIIGLIPGLGDILTGLVACILLFAGWARGLPYIALARMVANIGIDVLIGSIPVLGDAFDIAWKANRRNYELMQRHLRQPRRHTWKDWIFLTILLAVVMSVLIAPALVLVWMISLLRR